MSRPFAVPPWNPSNQLLDRVPSFERSKLIRSTRIVHLAFGSELAQPDREMRHVYFPLTSFISLVAPASGASTLEVAMVGNEGMLGNTMALGIRTPPLFAIVQGAGTALRIEAAEFRRQLRQCKALSALTLRYCYAQYQQASQAAVCSQFHPVEPRLARWLLMSQDRAGGADLRLTQAFLSTMLGVRRVGVTLAAQSLQRRRLIQYTRGRIAIMNRPGLVLASCSCYATDCRTHLRALNGPAGE